MSSRSARVCVVSADPERRADWARSLSPGQFVVSQCTGEVATCPVLAGSTCQLLDRSDVVIYDRATLHPAIARALASRPPGGALVFVANDDGHGRPTALGPVPVRRHGRGTVTPRFTA